MALIDNLVSYYKCDENAANTTVADSHGSNTGTLAGGNTTDKSVNGKINTGFALDGTGDWVVLNTPVFKTDGTAQSGFMWVKGTSGTQETPMSQYTVSQDGRMLLGILATGNLYFFLGGSGYPGQYDSGVTAIDGTFKHIGFTIDSSGNLKLYVDGAQAGTTQSGYGGNFRSADTIFGSLDESGGGILTATIDEIGIWSRALTSDEVSELYNSGAGLAYPFAVGTNMLINIADTFKDVDNLQINIGDVWKDVPQVLINIGDSWKTVYEQ